VNGDSARRRDFGLNRIFEKDPAALVVMIVLAHPSPRTRACFSRSLVSWPGWTNEDAGGVRIRTDPTDAETTLRATTAGGRVLQNHWYELMRLRTKLGLRLRKLEMPEGPHGPPRLGSDASLVAHKPPASETDVTLPCN
jgi:hypothetical protein